MLFQDQGRVGESQICLAFAGVLDVWCAPKGVKTGYEVCFNQGSHRAEPLQPVVAEAEGLLGVLIDGWRPSIVTQIGTD